MPDTFRTIAIATDLSERGDRAFDRAFRLAAAQGARLMIFSVVDDHLPEDMQETMAEGTRVRLEKAAAAQPGADTLDWSVTVLCGTPDTALAQAIGAHGIDLLVVGLHRHRPFMDLLRETTMERLVKLADCPVLIVRTASPAPYGTVLAALDFAPASGRALRLAHRLAPEAALHGVHAVHIPYQTMVAAPGIAGEIPPVISAEPFLAEARTSRDAFLDSHADLPGLSVEIGEGSIHAVLRGAMDRLHPDLIALGAHGRALPVPWLLGSFANDMMRDPPTDLLIAPPSRG